MPITRVDTFSPAADLHVLRGAQPILLHKLLQVTWGEGDAAKSGSLEEYIKAHGPVPDVVVEFRPTFQYPPNQPTFENFKIRITRGSGELHVLAGPVPEPKPHNFIIEATLVFNGTAPLPKERIARLRVHVHESVERIWMTPSRISVPRPAAPPPPQPWTGRTFFRFTVRAQFNDGSAADITNTPHYAADPADVDCVSSTSEPPWIRIPENMTAGHVRTISFRTTPAWNSRPAHADIAVIEPWPTATNVPKAELVDGHPGVWDGTLKPEKVPNVLFLGIGFRPLDTEAFANFTNMLAHRMRTDRRLTPYRYLATSMNYWRAFVPAPEAGVSVRCEVYSFLKDGRRFALPVPAPAPPPETGTWKLGHLVFVAGLPVASDLNFVREEGQTQPPPSLDAFNEIAPKRLDFSLLLNKWAATVSPSYAQSLGTLDSALLKKWVALANRTFIDEVDNFPNVAVGEPPSANFDESGMLDFYGQRGGASLFFEPQPERASFFRRLVGVATSGTVIALDGSGNPPTELGNLWAEDRSNFTFDNRSLVVALCNMPIGRSERFLGRSNWKAFDALFSRPTLKFATAPNDLAGLPVAETPGRKALRLDVPPLASLEALPETWLVLAHELSHAFGLGDEYSEAMPGPLMAFGPDLSYPNLQRSELVLNPDKSVKANRIKWNWHRVRKASVITRPIVDMHDSSFRVFVAKGSGFQFQPGDGVRLRQRVPREPLRADPLTSDVEFGVQSVHAENLDNQHDPLNMTVVIKKNPLIDIDVTPFGPGSLIYAPVPAPDSVRTLLRPYLTLVSPAAERIMAAIGGTMSGKDCDTSDMAAFRAAVQIPRLPINELPSFAPRSDMTTIVGAYYGGAQVACEVVHPAGSCFMRTGFDGFTIFCPVCRYALIDLIDPEKHWRNDLDYDKEYTI